MTEEIVVIPGDGIGAGAIPVTVGVLKVVGSFKFIETDAGSRVKKEAGEALPQEMYDLAIEAGATLLGTTSEAATDVILPPWTAADSFVNVHPAETYPGVDVLRPKAGFVFLRESTGGIYLGHENRLSEDLSTLTHVVTISVPKRFAEYACNYVGSEGGSFQAAHRANVTRGTDSYFRDATVAVADERGVETEEVLMDVFAARVCLDPTQSDTIICPNLAGDTLLDLVAGLAGGLGLLPLMNTGPDAALFRPVHGSAPDIAGEDIANPAAAIPSTAMLPDYLDHEAKADCVRSAVGDVLADGPHTPDLGGNASMEDAAAAILDRL